MPAPANPRLESLQAAAAPLIAAVAEHRVWSLIEDLPSLRVFLEHHVFCVWDFMSLLKSLQAQVTCLTVPWLPTGEPQSRWLINSIVQAEESDQLTGGRFVSHYELYLAAMHEAGAETVAIESFIDLLRSGQPLETALVESEAPEPAVAFVQDTFAVLGRNKPHATAAAFSLGREEAIPAMFVNTVAALERQQQDGTLRGNCSVFAEYLERHIELDGDEHGPMSLSLIANLCGNIPARWHEATEAATFALESRLRLWDALATKLESQREAAGTARE